MVSNRTFDKRQSCSGYKEWFTDRKSIKKLTALPEDWLRPPLQNNGWIRALVEQKMRDDDKTVAVQLHVHAMLKEHGYNTSLRTILRCWTSLGWTFQGSKYRQLIRALKRFELAWPYITESFEPSAVSAMSHGLTSLPSNWKAINSALKSSVPTVEAQSLSIFFTP